MLNNIIYFSWLTLLIFCCSLGFSDGFHHTVRHVDFSKYICHHQSRSLNRAVKENAEGPFIQDRSNDSLIREREELQNELHWVEAIELRNQAQIMSFVDEKAQWESMTDQERNMLLRRPYLEARLDEIDILLGRVPHNAPDTQNTESNI
jgi:hypothetical protein